MDGPFVQSFKVKLYSLSEHLLTILKQLCVTRRMPFSLSMLLLYIYNDTIMIKHRCVIINFKKEQKQKRFLKYIYQMYSGDA